MAKKSPTKQTPRIHASPPGPVSLFRGKLRKPVTCTLIPDHHVKLQHAQDRLDITRADVIGLLIEMYADKLKVFDVNTIWKSQRQS